MTCTCSRPQASFYGMDHRAIEQWRYGLLWGVGSGSMEGARAPDGCACWLTCRMESRPVVLGEG